MRQTKQEKALDRAIDQEYRRQGEGVQVDIMAIPRIFDDCRAAVVRGGSLELAVTDAISKYRQN